MTTRRHNANPFARVLGAATMAPSRPVAVTTPTPSQPASDGGSTATSSSAPRPVSTDAAPVLTAASQRWRNYAPPVAAVPETAPTTKETPEPAAVAIVGAAPRRSFVSTRRLASRAPLVAAAQATKEPAVALPTTEAGHDNATAVSTSHTPASSIASPSAGPACAPSPVPHLPLAIPVALPARTETAASPSCLQHATPLCDPTPSDIRAPLVQTPAIMTNPVPGGTESATALAAALAEVARQRALVARLVAIVAADCPACCAKVVGVLVDAPVSQGIPSAVVPAVPAAPLSTGLPQQHNHFHLSIDTRRESTHANRLRQKAMGVARKSLSSTGRRKRPSTL